LFEQNAMCAYDICQFNNETIGLGDAVGAMVQQVGQVDVRAVDTQTYYTAVPVQPAKSDKLRLLPGQRATL
jgi:hypothetical protein